MLSVICPVYNEEKYIGHCINSILRQDYPTEDMEVIFADGMSTDATRSIVASYAARYPFIRLIDNPDRRVSQGMNRAIGACRGDVVIRLDAHAEYPGNYFSRRVEALAELGAENVGGVCITLPCAETDTSRAIAAVLSTPFGMGNSTFRVGTDRIKEVDTVPFGCWHRSLFDRIGLFDTDLVRNQDDEFNGRIIRHGGRIFLLPDVQIKYYARDKIKKVARMFYQYGLFKPLVNKKLGSPATARQFVPVALVVGLAAGAVLSLCWSAFAWVYGAGVLLYLLTALAVSVGSGGSLRKILTQAWTYVVVHVCYGAGYLDGLFRLLFNRPFTARANR